MSSTLNTLQAQLYLMYGAMDGNRLCAMAMGNKHAFALDSVPHDYEQGYGLYTVDFDSFY